MHSFSVRIYTGPITLCLHNYTADLSVANIMLVYD